MKPPKNKFRVIINHDSNTKVEVKKWQLQPFGDEYEPNRVAIDFGGRSYSFVMGKEVTVEVWELDERDEIFKMVEVLCPKKTMMQLFKEKIRNLCQN